MTDTICPFIFVIELFFFFLVCQKCFIRNFFHIYNFIAIFFAVFRLFESRHLFIVTHFVTVRNPNIVMSAFGNAILGSSDGVSYALGQLTEDNAISTPLFMQKNIIKKQTSCIFSSVLSV